MIFFPSFGFRRSLEIDVRTREAEGRNLNNGPSEGQ